MLNLFHWREIASRRLCNGAVGGIWSKTVLAEFCCCPQLWEYILPHYYELSSLCKKLFLLAPCFLNDIIYLTLSCTQI